ncbi:hypothetical protein AX15_003392 [Amanita polypyramis BW_CC]|nr:hypothetical protein AX15_003392 [Amanita polypyramis BW_CC]
MNHRTDPKSCARCGTYSRNSFGLPNTTTIHHQYSGRTFFVFFGMTSNDAAPRTPINFLEYHRPRLRLNQARIPTLTQQSKECLRNLASYRAPKPQIPFPRSRCAAVLVALFVGRAGDVYVLLNRRSTTLRSYAGDTSLPGGKVEEGDRLIEDTARREAFEEIGLPRDRKKVPLLCILEPFLASNDLIVTPVVVLILDHTLRPILNTAEVALLFSHPLGSLLDETPPFPHEPESVEVPYHTNYDWQMEGPNREIWSIRGHTFLTGREAGGTRPITGLTAAILIRVAEIGYARSPSYEAHPEGEPSTIQRMAWAMLEKPLYWAACEAEGIKMDRELLCRLATGTVATTEQGEEGSRTGTANSREDERNKRIRHRWRRPWSTRRVSKL